MHVCVKQDKPRTDFHASDADMRSPSGAGLADKMYIFPGSLVTVAGAHTQLLLPHTVARQRTCTCDRAGTGPSNSNTVCTFIIGFTETKAKSTQLFLIVEKKEVLEFVRLGLVSKSEAGKSHPTSTMYEGLVSV